MQEIATYLRAVLDIFNNLMSEVVGILTTGPEAFSDTLYNLTNLPPVFRQSAQRW